MWQGTKLFSWISLLFVIVYSSRVYGQAEVALPRMSPSARVTFSIGFTEIDISYSSPAVRNRPSPAGSASAATPASSRPVTWIVVVTKIPK